MFLLILFKNVKIIDRMQQMGMMNPQAGMVLKTFQKLKKKIDVLFLYDIFKSHHFQSFLYICCVFIFCFCFYFFGV